MMNNIVNKTHADICTAYMAGPMPENVNIERKHLQLAFGKAQDRIK